MKISLPDQGSAQNALDSENTPEAYPSIRQEEEVQSASLASSQPSILGNALVEQISTKVSSQVLERLLSLIGSSVLEEISSKAAAKILEELHLEIHPLEERILKRLVAILNSSVIPSFKECTMEVAKGYEAMVQMVDILERRIHKIEDFLQPDDQEPDLPPSPPAPDQPSFPPAPDHPPSPPQGQHCNLGVEMINSNEVSFEARKQRLEPEALNNKQKSENEGGIERTGANGLERRSVNGKWVPSANE